MKKDTKGDKIEKQVISILPFVTYNTNADKDSNKEWLKEGLEGLAHTRASRTLRSTIHNANNNANKKWSSKITKKKRQIGIMDQTKIKRIVNKIFMPTRYKMLPYPSALMRVPAWGVIATSAVVMVLTMHRIKYSFSL